MVSKLKWIAIFLAPVLSAVVTLLFARSLPRGDSRVLLAVDRPRPLESVPPIRVALTPKSVTTVEVRVDGPYRVQPVDDWRVLAQGDRLKLQKVEILPGGFRIGSRTFPVTRLEIIPIRHPTLWVGDAQYRGTVQLIRRSGGKMVVVNVVDLEDYLASVLNSELPADFPTAARQTQAIAARTYALYQLKTLAASRDYDLRNDTSSQVYRGVQYRDGDRRLAVETPESREIVEQTRGIVATYRGRLFCTYYSAICGGRTTHGEDIFKDAAAPLTSVPCEWCEGSKYYRWEKELARTTLEAKLDRWTERQKKPTFGSLKQIKVLGDGESGHVPEVHITGADRKAELSAYAFRLAVGPSDLKSGFFDVQEQGDVFHFQGRGWGHGVGLCQWGARGQALAGRTGIEIFHHYYPGSTLVAVR